MTQDQIMKLVDEYVDERIMATKGRSDGVDVALVRAAVVAAIEQLTKDAARYQWLINDGTNRFWRQCSEMDSYEEVVEAIDTAIAAQKGEQV